MFSFEYCEIFKNTYFEEHLRTAASVGAQDLRKSHCKKINTNQLTGFYMMENIGRLWITLFHVNVCQIFYLDHFVKKECLQIYMGSYSQSERIIF